MYSVLEVKMMFEKIANFFSTFKDPVCVILGVIGLIAGGCSFIPVLPTWLNITLKVIGIGAPVIGLLVGVIKFFKNRKKIIAPETFVERSFTKDETLDEMEIAEALEAAYEDIVDESTKYAKKDSKVYDEVEVIDNKKTVKANAKKNNNFKSNLSSANPTFHKIFTCPDAANGIFDEADRKVATLL